MHIDPILSYIIVICYYVFIYVHAFSFCVAYFIYFPTFPISAAWGPQLGSSYTIPYCNKS